MKQPNNTTIYNTALYLRLSRDDELQGESGSIRTQRMMLREYAHEHGLNVVGEYIDDGWSGTNFDRPEFQRMIDDIEDGRINCVVTKDLSRLGRNYILTGQYTELYFPSKGVRYIAINDNVDTLNGDNELAPFLNILNEMHARQTSKKVKAAFRTRFANGAHYGNGYPETDKLIVISKELNVSLDYLLNDEAVLEEKEKEEPRPVVYVPSGRIAIPTYDKSKVVVCHAVKSSKILFPSAGEPEYLLFGVDKVTFWGEHTTILGWYHTQEDVQKEILEITEANWRFSSRSSARAFQNGDSYEKKRQRNYRCSKNSGNNREVSLLSDWFF